MFQSYTKIPISQYKDLAIPNNALSPIYVLQMSSNNKTYEYVFYLGIVNDKLLLFRSALTSSDENFGIKQKTFKKISEFDYKTN